MSALFDRPLDEPLDQPLPNTVWTIVRAFAYIAAFLGLLAAIFVIIGCRSRANVAGASAGGAWRMAAFLTTPVIASMVLAAAISAFAASRGDRALEAIRRGNYFVRWDYDAATWSIYGVEQAKALRTVGWIIALFAVVMGALISFGLTVTPDSFQHKARVIFVLDLCDIAFITLVLCAFRTFGRWRLAAVQRRPIAIIGPNAAYSGGDLLFWNSAGNALYSARLLPAATSTGIATLELVIGLSSGTRNVARMTDAALHLTGHAAMVSKYRVTRRIPVPRGQEQRAVQICARLMQGEPVAAAVARAPLPVARAARKPSLTSERPRPKPRPGARWWKITMSMAGTGTLMFCMLVLDEMRTGGHAAKVATAVGGLGACIALAAVAPLCVALMYSVRDFVNRA